jgi:CHAD domain-containing protein
METWMNRVLELADAVQEGWKAKDVHDLRVALRRCRTMADALSEVNPDRGWRKLKKDSRELFRALGELRDTQVEQEWLKKLSAGDDPVRKHLLKTLAQAESKQQREAEKALDDFDRKSWRKWSQKLGDKAQFFPLESVVFQRLALTRLNEAAELFQRARKGRSRIAWHRLRIGLKGFRYTLENFMLCWAKCTIWTCCAAKSGGSARNCPRRCCWGGIRKLKTREKRASTDSVH